LKSCRRDKIRGMNRITELLIGAQSSIRPIARANRSKFRPDFEPCLVLKPTDISLAILLIGGLFLVWLVLFPRFTIIVY
jgi:hypothetical protein